MPEGGKRRWAVLMLVFVAAFPAAFPSEKKAPKPYALIAGTVYAPDNRPAYGVKIKIRYANQRNAKWEVYSDHQGEFAQRVPPGSADYVVWAEPDGKHGPKPETKVHVEYDERVDVGLHLTK